MPQDLYVRRNRSALKSGEIFRPRRKRFARPLLVLVLFALAGAALVFWQLPAIQPAALAVVGIRHTPTPTLLESAQQGDLAFWRGNLTEAVTHYRAAAQIDPFNVDIGYELARMLIYRSYNDERNRADIDEAVAIASALTGNNPRSERAFAIECYALLRAERPEDALQACRQAISLNGDDPNAYAFRALVYYDLGRYEEASEDARAALERDPANIEGNTAYGWLLVGLRRSDAAVQYFEKAAELNKRLEFPYFNLAVTTLSIALARGDQAMYQKTIDAYNTVLAMNKRSVKAYTSLCRAYFAFGEQNLARDNCRTAADLDGTYTPAWRWLGEVNYRTMEYEQASDALQRCTDQEKDLPVTARQPECWYFLGLSYVQQGDCARAMPVFNDLLSWTRSQQATDMSNKGIRVCTGREPTPGAGS